MRKRKLSVCQHTLDPAQSFQEDVDELARLGIDGITVAGPKLNAIGIKKAKRVLRDAGLTVAAYHASVGWFGMPGEYAARVAASKRRIEEGAELGAEFVLVKTGPRGAMTLEEAKRTFLSGLREALPKAREMKVPLVLEPSHPMAPWNSFVHSLHDTLDLVAGIEDMGVLMDAWHCWWDWRLLDDIRGNVRRIYNVQIDDYAKPTGPVEITTGGPRVPPGEGMIPLKEILHTLDKAGYDRFYDVEVIGDFTPERRKNLVADCKAWFEAVWRG